MNVHPQEEKRKKKGEIDPSFLLERIIMGRAK